MKKTIFLDIDGVLNSARSCEFYHQKNNKNGFGGFFNEGEEPSFENVKFDLECVCNLRNIILTTNCQIVISSTWRKSFFVDTFNKIFKLYGLPQCVVGTTPVLYTFKLTRGNEIKKYIDENQINDYIIIDDDGDMLDEQKPFFIRTKHSIGLSSDDAKKAIEILNKSNELDETIK